MIVPSAQDRLVTLPDDAPLLEAAACLRVGTDLVVVCDRNGRMRGVVSKTDVVDQISHCEGATCQCAVATVMTVDVLHCWAEELLLRDYVMGFGYR